MGLLFLGVYIVVITNDVTQHVVTETSSCGEVILRNNSGYRIVINGRSYAPGVHTMDIEPGTRLDVSTKIFGVSVPIGTGHAAGGSQ